MSFTNHRKYTQEVYRGYADLAAHAVITGNREALANTLRSLAGSIDNHLHDICSAEIMDLFTQEYASAMAHHANRTLDAQT